MTTCHVLCLAYAIPIADLKVLLIGGHSLPHTDFCGLLDSVFPELEHGPGGALQLTAAPSLRAIYTVADPRERHLPTAADLNAAAGDVPETAVRSAAAAVRAEDACLMIFSSGTTARPKACLLSHKSLNRAGRALAERFGMTDADRCWDPLPLFHIARSRNSA